MKSRNLNGSLAIVGVGVAIGVLAFAWDVKVFLVLALIITVLGGGIAFYKSMESS